METRIFGKTGLEVTALGLGTAELGYLDLPQSECDSLLNGTLDAGITVIDTAASYPNSENKIGRAISHRRDEYVLISKCGQKLEADDPPEWSGKNATHSAERSLRRLKTDHLDVLLVHSCPAEALRYGDLVEGMQECKERGLARFIGYSGDNRAAEVALEMGVFDCLESSLNICDQQLLHKILPEVHTANLGFISKRSIANSCWRNLALGEPFYAKYAATYTERLKKMDFSPESIGFDGSWIELALRFTAWQPGLHIALIGGRNLEHIREDIKIADRGPLPEPILRAIREIWNQHDDGSWVGQI